MFENCRSNWRLEKTMGSIKWKSCNSAVIYLSSSGDSYPANDVTPLRPWNVNKAQIPNEIHVQASEMTMDVTWEAIAWAFTRLHVLQPWASKMERNVKMGFVSALELYNQLKKSPQWSCWSQCLYHPVQKEQPKSERNGLERLHKPLTGYSRLVSR